MSRNIMPLIRKNIVKTNYMNEISRNLEFIVSSHRGSFLSDLSHANKFIKREMSEMIWRRIFQNCSRIHNLYICEIPFYFKCLERGIFSPIQFKSILKNIKHESQLFYNDIESCYVLDHYKGNGYINNSLKLDELIKRDNCFQSGVYSPYQH